MAFIVLILGLGALGVADATFLLRREDFDAEAEARAEGFGSEG